MYFITHPDCLLHDVGAWHPERPARLTRLKDHLIAKGQMDFLRPVDAPAATRDQLLAVHAPAYLARLDRLAASATPDTPAVIDSDTMVTPFTLRAAARAAGAVVCAVDLVLAAGAHGRVDGVRPLHADRAFCAVRPPGHHASRESAMGFCFFNNVAIGAAHAAARYDLQRIAIVDFDVHHGNGTQDYAVRIAAEEVRPAGAIPLGPPPLLFISAFQYPFYPPVADGPPPPDVVHVRLPGGTDSTAFRDAVRAHIAPPLAEYNPELLLISAGFDGHAADPYANWRLHEDDYAFITEALIQATACPIVSVLEGGYDLAALARSAAAHIRALMQS